MLNIGNVDTEIPLPNSVARVWEVCMECPKWKEKKKIWQTNCGNAIAKIGEKKTEWFWNLCKSKKKKCHVYNIFIINHMWLVIINSNLNLTLKLFF